MLKSIYINRQFCITWQAQFCITLDACRSKHLRWDTFSPVTIASKFSIWDVGRSAAYASGPDSLQKPKQQFFCDDLLIYWVNFSLTLVEGNCKNLELVCHFKVPEVYYVPYYPTKTFPTFLNYLEDIIFTSHMLTESLVELMLSTIS